MIKVEKEWGECRRELESFIDSYFSNDKRLLAESMLYTLKQGKKFRPFLCYATAKIFSSDASQSTAFAAAIEMLHAFSLIHDDLPALDNDDFRRGLKTNHKVYGEDVAILSGDALLNEAYLLVSEHYKDKPSLALDLVQLMAKAIGRDGMIEGQILDLKAQKNKVQIEELKKIHQLKTACLMQAATLGVAKIYSASAKEIAALSSYSSGLGLGFQIADDLLEEQEEMGSYVALLGREGAQKALEDCSEFALQSLEVFDDRAEILKAIVKVNLKREH